MEKRSARLFHAAAARLLGEVRWLDLRCKSGRLAKNAYYDALTGLILQKVLDRSSVCLDVGCHEGSVLEMMLRYAPEGTFYAFEPLPHLFEHLQEKYRGRPNISLSDLALHDRAGETDFNYVISNPGYSGLLKRRYDRPYEEDTTIRVRTERMDALFADIHPEFIKIDVEGAELQVLRGGREVIRRDRPWIVFEHGLGAADYYGTTPEAVYDLLCMDCGLNLTLLNSYLLHRPPLSRQAFCRQFYEGLNYYFLAYSG